MKEKTLKAEVIEADARKVWLRDPAIRAEFKTFGTYLAWRQFDGEPVIAECTPAVAAQILADWKGDPALRRRFNHDIRAFEDHRLRELGRKQFAAGNAA